MSKRERESKIMLLVFLVDGCLAFFKIMKRKISEYSSNEHHFACLDKASLEKQVHMQGLSTTYNFQY